MPRSFAHIFGDIGQSPDRQFLVRASYLEIYQEQVRLLPSFNPAATHKTSSIQFSLRSPKFNWVELGVTGFLLVFTWFAQVFLGFYSA